jgi:hypothetical protein
MAERKIGGRIYKVEPLLATQALALQGRLMKAAGPAFDRLPEAIAQIREKGVDGADGNVVIIKVIGDIFSSLSTEEYVSLVRDIVEVAKIQRPSGTFDNVDLDGDMSGPELGNIVPLAAFVLKEQFSDFFSGLLGNGSRGTKKAAA